MLSTMDYAFDLNSHFQIENVLLSAARQIKHSTTSESAIESFQADGCGFVRGILIALPVSALFWGLILWAAKMIF
jgi:hypothetical protein